MKILLMIFLLPMTVCAAMPMYGSASATIENRKGIYIFSTEDALEAGEGNDAPMVDVDFDNESTELFATPDYELIVDEPDAEEQDLADTLLSDEVSEE